MRLQFSKNALDALKPPKKRTWLRDTKVVGLACMLTPAGGRIFYVDIWRDGKRRQIKLGAYPEMTVDEARQLARRQITACEQGTEVATTSMTMDQLFRKWHELESVPRKRTHQEDMRKWTKNFASIHKIPILALSATDVDKALRKVMERGAHRKGQGKPNYSRNLTLIRTVLRWAVRRGMLEKAVTDALKPFTDISRERFMDSQEIDRYLSATRGMPELWRDFFQLLLYTGSRRGALAQMAWRDVNLIDGLWTIPARVAKSGKSITVPLIPQALAILQGRKEANDIGSHWVFPGGSVDGHMNYPKKAWKKLTAAANLVDLTPHDVRRTTASMLVAANVNLAVIGRLLGHAPGSKQTFVYARMNTDTLRQAMGAVSQTLTATHEKKQANPE